jgi:hypothetical protein
MTERDGAEPDVIDQGFAVLDDAVDFFHDRVLRPIALLGRSLAYGAVFLALGLTLVVLTVILAVRIADDYLFAAHPWLSDVVIGALFWFGGLVIWRRRRPDFRSRKK